MLRVRGDSRLWGKGDVEQQLLKTFRSGLESTPAQVVLSLAPISSIDTLGIAALVRVLIECSKRQIDLKVVMPPGAAGDALRCVRVFEPWPEFADEKAAIEAARAWSAAGTT